jgi:hypothetical protein
MEDQMKLRGGSSKSQSYEFGVDDELALICALKEFKTHMEKLFTEIDENKTLIVHIKVTVEKWAEEEEEQQEEEELPSNIIWRQNDHER